MPLTHRLPKGCAQRRALESTESLDVPFELEAPGLIIVVAATGTWGATGLLPRPHEDAHSPHRIELFPPGSAAPVAARKTEAAESTLVHEASASDFVPGRWTARLTNLGTRVEEFGLHVSYPSARELRFADIATDAFPELARIRLEFQRGNLASRLEIETSAGPVTHFFTLEEIEYSCPWMPRVRGYFDDVRSTSVALSIPEGSTDPIIRCEVAFEDEGLELNGTIPLDLRRMTLTLDLPVLVRYHKLAASKRPTTIEYDEAGVRASFTFEPAFEGLAEWLPGFFAMWRRSIQRTVEAACRELLASDELKQLFSKGMEARVLSRIGPDAKPVGVAAADGKLRFSYYEI
jgi:hypothetical protein